jgi:hypothetical protein
VAMDRIECLGMDLGSMGNTERSRIGYLSERELSTKKFSKMHSNASKNKIESKYN